MKSINGGKNRITLPNVPKLVVLDVVSEYITAFFDTVFQTTWNKTLSDPPEGVILIKINENNNRVLPDR